MGKQRVIEAQKAVPWLAGLEGVCGERLAADPGTEQQ